MGFYVSSEEGKQKTLCLGPWRTHGDAAAQVATMRKWAMDNLKDATFAGWGTAHSRFDHLPGKFNDQLGLILGLDGYVSLIINDAAYQTHSITPEAQRTLSAMQERLGAISANFGPHSEEYLETVESFAFSVLQVLRLGGKLYSDGELSLYGVSFIHYGVVFHRRYIDGDYHPLLGTWSVHS